MKYFDEHDIKGYMPLQKIKGIYFFSFMRKGIILCAIRIANYFRASLRVDIMGSSFLPGRELCEYLLGFEN